MLHSLLIWDAEGEIVGTLDYMVARQDGVVIGLIDFEGHEAAGGRMREIVEIANAAGAGTWPEWLGGRAHEFRVELHDSPAPARAKIVALVHKKSGHRRERAPLEAVIEQRMAKVRRDAAAIGGARRIALRQRNATEEEIAAERDPEPTPADIRDLVGGPDRPLLLDGDGKTMARPKVEPPNLPVIGRG